MIHWLKPNIFLSIILLGLDLGTTDLDIKIKNIKILLQICRLKKLILKQLPEMTLCYKDNNTLKSWQLFFPCKVAYFLLPNKKILSFKRKNCKLFCIVNQI